MAGAQVLGRARKGGADRGVEVLQRVRERLGGDAQVRGTDAVEPFGGVAHGRGPAVPDVVEDRSHGLSGGRDVHLRTRQHVRQIGAVQLTTPEVNPTQHAAKGTVRADGVANLFGGMRPRGRPATRCDSLDRDSTGGRMGA